MPSSLALNPAADRIYVAEAGTNVISVLDGASNAVIGTVAVGGPPRGLAVNAVTNRIYVARSLTADVLVIDGATNAIIATVALAGASE
jgi:YVTN family beta-propeller protein